MKLRSLLSLAALCSAFFAVGPAAFANIDAGSGDANAASETPAARCAKVVSAAECPGLVALLEDMRRPQKSAAEQERLRAEFNRLSPQAQRWLIGEYDVALALSATAAPVRDRASATARARAPNPPRARGGILGEFFGAIVPNARRGSSARQQTAQVQPPRRPDWLKVGH
jgi:hypothetical protein